MTNDVLLKTQKNDVLRLIHQQGLDAAEFAWRTKHETSYTEYGELHHTISVLVRNPSGFYFEFGHFESRYSPGEGQMAGRAERQGWDSRLGEVAFWLYGLQRELTAPDLWATVFQEKAAIEAVSREDVDNRPFSPQEQLHIAAKLNEIKGRLTTVPRLQQEQVRLIDDRFAYLEQASNRLGRRDWFNTAIGAVLAISISSAFQPLLARHSKSFSLVDAIAPQGMGIR